MITDKSYVVRRSKGRKVFVNCKNDLNDFKVIKDFKDPKNFKVSNSALSPPHPVPQQKRRHPFRGVVYLKSLINGAFARLAKYSDAEHKKADTEVSAFYLKNRFGVRNFKAREDF